MTKDRVSIIQADITQLSVDAIVNAANTKLAGGGGVDGAIHRVAGPELAQACKEIGYCETGQAVITPGFNLPAKFIVHTVGPVWNGGNHNEAKLLASCYQNSLALAKENGLKSIAFPSISTGVYGYPFIQACKVALKAIDDFTQNTKEPKEIILVCYSQGDYEEYVKLLA